MSVLNLLTKGKLERERTVRKKVAVAVTVDVALGAVAGVLMAPKAGRKTREELLKSFREFPDKAKEFSDKAQEMIIEGKGITEETRKLMSGVSEKMAEVTDEVKEESHFKKPSDITEEQVDSFKKKLK